MIKDVVSNFFYNNYPYPVSTRARKNSAAAPRWHVSIIID